MEPFHWLEGGTVSRAVTQASANVALAKMPTGKTQLRIHNKGPNMAFIAKGTDSTVTAATTDYPVPAGITEVLTLNNRESAPITHIAAIAATGETATLYFTIGTGE